MTYSNKEMIKLVNQAKKNKKKLVHITNKKALSSEDRIKLGLCKHFVQFLVAKDLKRKDVAEMIGIPLPRVSEITNYKIDKFTVDQLIRNLSLLARHDSRIKEFLVFFENVAELPTLQVTQTKKLIRNIRDAATQHALY